MKNATKKLEQLTKELARARQRINELSALRSDSKFAEENIRGREAEEALRASEERYRDLFNNANDIIYTHDLEGTITSINSAGERITGYTREQVLGKNIADVLAPGYLELARQMIQRKISENVPTTYELEIRARDGRRVALEVSTRAIHEHGKIIGVQGIARDVTGRKVLEAQLLQALKMEAIGRLAGGVAHDFNNQLTAILGYTDLLLASKSHDSCTIRELGEIKKAAERAASLTRQLLAFSRKQILAPQVLDFNSTIVQIDPMLRRLIGEDIELVTSLAADLGHVKADPVQIEQIIMNLVVNARDAMPEGGKLTIETANVYLDEGSVIDNVAPQPGPYVVLAVCDTGSGMDLETQSHIFEPFFTTKEPGKGTGLGLSTVYGIVKQSGGYIWASGQPGCGSTFKLYLPRIDEPLEPQGAKIAEAPLPRGLETILLVEDEDAIRVLVRNILSKNGYTVLEACDGNEALQHCHEHADPIHLMVTDVVMPGISGTELASRAAFLRPGMRILYISGYTDEAIVQHGAPNHGTAFLQKPFTPDVLARKVREVLDSPIEELTIDD